jgi:hypothetical protein
VNDEKQIAEWFEKYEDNHLDFDSIPADKRLHPQDDLCALLKVSSLMKDPSKFNLRAEHDEIFFGDFEDLGTVTEEDVLYLARCGVSWDDDGFMCKFV